MNMTEVQMHFSKIKEFALSIGASWVSWEPSQIDLVLAGCSYTFDLTHVKESDFHSHLFDQVYKRGFEAGKNNIRRAFKNLMETE